ncbi:MAG: glutaredoxin family protein [Rhodoluna sp.]|nr:glutaredoxin family protein [Rhodoluna sp.]
MSYDISLTLIGKPGCHLCDDAHLVVNTVAGQFRSLHAGVASSVQVHITEQNILDDPELAARYSEEIPVLLLNGKVHNYWKIDPIRLMAALEEAIR